MASLFYDRFNEARTCNGQYPPEIMKTIRSKFIEGRKLSIKQFSDNSFGVFKAHGDIRLVNLQDQTCSCLEYQEFGMICTHVARVISFKKLEMDLYISNLYRTQALLNIYDCEIIPASLLDVHHDGLTKPPLRVTTRGRPTKKRIRSRAEDLEKDHYSCGKCGGSGHNVRGCTQREEVATSQPQSQRKKRDIRCENCGRSHYKKTPCNI